MKKILREEDIVILIDDREKLPYDMSPCQMRSARLITGDYSVDGMEQFGVCVERKSLADLCGSITQRREAFQDELRRMQGFAQRMLLIESSPEEILEDKYYSKVHPNAVLGSVISYVGWNVNVMFAGDRAMGIRITRRFLYNAAKRHWESLQRFHSAQPTLALEQP